ncbi:hypothetical protein [Nocardia sp. GAS34]|uniref:hypothetical protein n=1 Tax=Nocardia sp. GAS34 TaxID=3156305 RepID=UPI003D20504D
MAGSEMVVGAQMLGNRGIINTVGAVANAVETPYGCEWERTKSTAATCALTGQRWHSAAQPIVTCNDDPER